MGICMGDKEHIDTIEVIVRLWTHEITRVFTDRLINEEDRLTMLGRIQNVVRSVYGLNFDNVFEHLDNDGDSKVTTLDEMRHLMFTDVLAPIGLPKRPYEEIRDQGKLHKACEDALENYNMMGDKPMELVLFSFAVEHLLTICRILK